MTGDTKGPGGLTRAAIVLVIVAVAVGPATGAAGLGDAVGGGPDGDSPTAGGVERAVDGGPAARQVDGGGSNGSASLVLDAVELSTPRTETVGSNSHTASVIEISFARPVLLAGETRPLNESDVRVLVDGEDVTDRYTLDDDGSGGDGTRYAGQVVLSSRAQLDSYDDLVVELPPLQSLNGEITTEPLRIEPTITASTVVETDGDGDPDSDEVSIHVGRQLAVVADDGEGDIDNPIDISSGGSYVGSNATGEASQVWVFNTSAWTEYDGYEFDLTGDPGRDRDDNEMGVRYRQLDLSASLDAVSLDPGDTISGEVRADDVGRQFEVVLEPPYGANETRTVEIPVGSGTDYFRFPDADEGTYTVWVRDTLSDRVVKLPDVRVDTGSASFPEPQIREERGDVVTIPVELRGTDSALLTVGDSDEGYEAVVQVFDRDNDGRVDVQWNTYLADGSSDGTGEAFSVDDDSGYYSDTVVVRSVTSDVSGGDADPGQVIEATTYDVDVYVGPQATGPQDDVGTVDLTRRSLESITPLVAPERLIGTFEEHTDLEDAERTDNLTTTRAVATDDLLVFRLEATGLEGAVAAGPTPKAFLPNSEAVRLRIEEDPDLNEEPIALTFPADALRVVADGEEDRYYLLADTGDVRATRPSVETDEAGIEAVTDPAEELEIADGDRFNVSLTLREEATDLTDDDETVRTHVSLHERGFDVPDPYYVAGGSRVTTLAVGTTLAPGTYVDARIRGESNPGGAFLRLTRTVVDRDQVARFEIDGNLFPVGKEFRMTLNANGTDRVIEGEAAETAAPVTRRPPIESSGPTEPEPEPEPVTPEPIVTPTPTPTPAPTSTPTPAPNGSGDPSAASNRTPAGNASNGSDVSANGTNDSRAGDLNEVTTVPAPTPTGAAGAGGAESGGNGGEGGTGGGGDLGPWGALLGLFAALGPVVLVALLLARQSGRDRERGEGTDPNPTPRPPGPPDRAVPSSDLRSDGEGPPRRGDGGRRNEDGTDDRGGRGRRDD